MRISNTSKRLQQLISERNIRQIDIVELCKPICQKYNMKMNRSDISQYVSGKVEPNQHKLVILAEALGVTETWLMGFDVPNEKNTAEQAKKDIDLITKFAMLNPRDQEIVMNMIDTMLINKKTER